MLVEQRSHIESVDHVRSVVGGDFDGDGRNEVAMLFGSGSSVLAVIDYQNISEPVRQMKVLELGASRLHVLDRPSQDALVSISSVSSTSTGTTPLSVVRTFEGWPLVEVRQFSITKEVVASAIADVDADGGKDLLVCVGTELRAYELISGLLKWTANHPCYSLVVSQFDGDDALEIVMSGWPGIMIDGQSRQVEQTFPDGLSNRMFVASEGFAGANQLIAVDLHSDAITAYGGSPLTVSWRQNFGGFSSVSVGDTNGDGRAEVLQVGTGTPEVRIIDSVTRDVLGLIGGLGTATNIFTSSDLTGDGREEVILAPGSYSLLDNIAMRIVRAVSASTIYELKTSSGATVSTAATDFDADGEIELLIGNDSRSGSLRLLDYQRLDTEWAMPTRALSILDLNQITPAVILAAQLDASPEKEIVIAGSMMGQGRINVLDGMTKELRLSIDSRQQQYPFNFGGVFGAQLVDFEGLGLRDLAVVLPSYFSGARVRVYSLVSGALLWESESLGDLLPLDLLKVPATDHSVELHIAVFPDRLVAFDLATRSIVWTYPGSIQAATVVRNPGGVPELVVGQVWGNVTHLDLASRSVIREYFVPPPIQALSPIPYSRQMIVMSDRALRVTDSEGSELDSKEIRDFGAARNSTSISNFSVNDRQVIVVGRDFGFTEYSVRLEKVFDDGFDLQNSASE